MPGLVPGHPRLGSREQERSKNKKDVDGRDEARHDGGQSVGLRVLTLGYEALEPHRRVSLIPDCPPSWPGFVPAIHVFLVLLLSCFAAAKTWMPGTRRA